LLGKIIEEVYELIEKLARGGKTIGVILYREDKLP